MIKNNRGKLQSTIERLHIADKTRKMRYDQHHSFKK